MNNPRKKNPFPFWINTLPLFFWMIIIKLIFLELSKKHLFSDASGVECLVYCLQLTKSQKKEVVPSYLTTPAFSLPSLHNHNNSPQIHSILLQLRCTFNIQVCCWQQHFKVPEKWIHITFFLRFFLLRILSPISDTISHRVSSLLTSVIVEVDVVECQEVN